MVLQALPSRASDSYACCYGVLCDGIEEMSGWGRIPVGGQWEDTVSLSVSERSFKKRDPSLWTSPEKFVVLGDQT